MAPPAVATKHPGATIAGQGFLVVTCLHGLLLLQYLLKVVNVMAKKHTNDKFDRMKDTSVTKLPLTKITKVSL